MTRAEHLAWCKNRALEYVRQGDTANAYAPFASDMRKHPETADHAAITLGLQLMMTGSLSDPVSMRDFINGFN